MRTKRLLAEISQRLEPLAEIGATLERMDGTLERMDGTLGRLERESRSTRAAIENNTRVTREILLEVKEHRPILERIDDGVQSNTQGLMHVLDELRNGRGGPGTAPAA
jgi:hypothetical protein